MFAVIIGMCVGAGQMLLLNAITKPLLSGDKPKHAALLILAKLALYAVALLGTALLWPSMLVHMGVGLAAGLIVMSVVLFLRTSRRQKSSSAKPADQGGNDRV